MGLLCLGSMVALASAGCGGGAAATVSGKVLYKGAPLKGGNVTFVSTEGKTSISAAIKEDGSYQLANVPVGAVKICVETESLRSQVTRSMSKGPGTSGVPPSYKAPPGASEQTGYKPPEPQDTSSRYVQIPPQYAKADTTDLTYTVKSGSQSHDVELK
jgi:hypothetical protein